MVVTVSTTGGVTRTNRRATGASHGASSRARTPYQTSALTRWPDGYETPPTPKRSGCANVACGAGRAVRVLNGWRATTVSTNAVATAQVITATAAASRRSGHHERRDSVTALQ